MDTVRLQTAPLSLDDACRQVASDDCGAVATFSGTTRDFFLDRRVVRLEYEAYEPMAEQEMRQLCTRVRDKWNVKHIAIYHRLGLVEVGGSSVVIAISSCHRHDALQAVSYAIDQLKARVPIWKREVYADADPAATHPDTGAATQPAHVWKRNAECHWLQHSGGS